MTIFSGKSYPNSTRARARGFAHCWLHKALLIIPSWRGRRIKREAWEETKEEKGYKCPWEVSPGISPMYEPSVKKERSRCGEEGMMKRAMGDWRGSWLASEDDGSSSDSSLTRKRYSSSTRNRRERDVGWGDGGGRRGDCTKPASQPTSQSTT